MVPPEPTTPRTLLEARVLVPDWLLERFLEFCEEELGQLPDLDHVAPELRAALQPFLDLLSAQREDRVLAKLPHASRN